MNVRIIFGLHQFILETLSPFYPNLHYKCFAVLLIVLVCGSNNSSSLCKLEKFDHPMTNAWIWNLSVGLIGLFLNCTVLCLLIQEKGSMISAINVLIGLINLRVEIIEYWICFIKRMQEIYRILFSISANWRSWLMLSDNTFLRFLGVQRDMVTNLSSINISPAIIMTLKPQIHISFCLGMFCYGSGRLLNIIFKCFIQLSYSYCQENHLI